MLIRLLPLITAFASLAIADVQFTSPAPGATVDFGTISVAWKEGTGTTKLSDLAGFQIVLVVGGNTDATSQQLPATDLISGDHKGGTVTTAKLPVLAKTDGPPGKNAYFLKIISTTKTGGQVINYSNRFTINGMSGIWTPAVEAAYKASMNDPAAVPPAVDTPGTGGNPGAAPGAGGLYSVPFEDQTTGLIKYAPMQKHPPTAITKRDTAALFPTSKYTVAPTYLPTPSVTQTQTLSRTDSYKTRENTASPNPQPSDDMAKYLARWKD